MQINSEKKDEIDFLTERTWRDTELTWYDKYQKNSLWSMLCCVDQEALSRYYITLLEYPQTVDFPDGIRPTRPNLLCDADKTPEERWESDIQRQTTFTYNHK